MKNKMKVWTIISSALLIIFIATTSFLYIQNNSLKNDNDKLASDLTSAQSAKSELDKSIANTKTKVSQKLEIVKTFYSDNMTQEDQFKVYGLIQSINNATITADWQAMQNNQPNENNNSGQKLIQDLISTSLTDLK